MTTLRLACLAALCFFAAGCATGVTKPDTVAALSPWQIASLKVCDVTSEAAPGVQMSVSDLARMNAKVKNAIITVAPNTWVDPSSADGAKAWKLKMTFTDYDAGNALARGVLMGLGQIHIDADIHFVDRDGSDKGVYKVSKQYALGGFIGASTGIGDVEDGFAKSVAAIGLGQ